MEIDGADGDEGNDNEPKYCYCNDVSYGEMVACDNEACEREWFHLKCAGLTRAPDENSESFPLLLLLKQVMRMSFVLISEQPNGIARRARRT